MFCQSNTSSSGALSRESLSERLKTEKNAEKNRGEKKIIVVTLL